jgi:hypothetical protein
VCQRHRFNQRGTGACPDRGERDAANSRDRRTRLGTPAICGSPAKRMIHCMPLSARARPQPGHPRTMAAPAVSDTVATRHPWPAVFAAAPRGQQPAGQPPSGEPHWGACSALTAVRTHLSLPCGEDMKSRWTVEPSRCASSGAPGGTLSSLLRSGVINDQRACLDGDFVRTHRTLLVGWSWNLWCRLTVPRRMPRVHTPTAIRELDHAW